MRVITIIKLTIKDFRSFVNEEFEFPSLKGLKLLSGENTIEPRLGANGAGKSSLWEALCWCFYGTGIKGSRTSSLVSWGVEKTSVVTQFTLDKETYTVKRFGPPMRIELNGKPIQQEVLDSLLGLTRERFLHSVIFGQGVPLFPDLSIPQRGELLDEVLNLILWSNCSDSAGKYSSDIQLKLNEGQKQLSYLDGQVAQLQTEEQAKKLIDEWEANRQKDLTHLQTKMDWWEKHHILELKTFEKLISEWEQQQKDALEEKVQTLEKLESELASARLSLSDIKGNWNIMFRQLEELLATQKEESKEVEQKHYQLKAELKQVTSPKHFWVENNTCPTCLQDISQELKQNHLDSILEKESNLEKEIDTTHSTVLSLQRKITETSQQAVEMQRSAVEEQQLQKSLLRDEERITNEIKRVETDIEKGLLTLSQNNNPFKEALLEVENKDNPFVSEIVLVEEKVNPFLIQLKQLKETTEKLNEERKSKLDEISKFSSQKLASDYWRQGFKQIRLYFVQTILAALQIEIQSAISALGLNGWRVQLATESETKSGTIKLGIQIHIYSPTAEGSWEVWSGGESQRLRLAIAMGLASLIQRAAGVWFDCEVWDEPSAWLSSEGIENLLEALQYRAEAQQKQVWVVDHRALQFSGFKEIWSVSKGEEGSKVQLLSRALV